jgi:hypothetical protein
LQPTITWDAGSDGCPLILREPFTIIVPACLVPKTGKIST